MSTATRKKIRKRHKPYQRNRPNSKLHYEGAALVSIPESTRITGLGLITTYKMAREGTLPGVVQIGNRRWIHRGKLEAWLDSLGGSAA